MSESDQTPDQDLDPTAVEELFHLQPDNSLTKAQMVRRSLFPRWEVIIPAVSEPVQEEDRLLEHWLPDLPDHEQDENPGTH